MSSKCRKYRRPQVSSRTAMAGRGGWARGAGCAHTRGSRPGTRGRRGLWLRSVNQLPWVAVQYSWCSDESQMSWSPHRSEAIPLATHVFNNSRAKEGLVWVKSRLYSVIVSKGWAHRLLFIFTPWSKPGRCNMGCSEWCHHANCLSVAACNLGPCPRCTAATIKLPC